jgi:phosphoadenosine phosphosulfate reductase
MSSSLHAAERSAEAKSGRIRERLDAFHANGRRLFATSSFQSHSMPLLHILAQWRREIPIVFLNTGYLFPDTLKFRDLVADQLNLRVIDLIPAVPKSEQRTADGRLFFASDPDRCCQVNKVDLLDPFLRKFDIWVNGVRGEQTSTRSRFRSEEPGPHSSLRYHPILDWTNREIFAYRQAHDLPAHPLESQGYLSVGCMPCTIRHSQMLDERDGRWSGQSKSECGLHTQAARGSAGQK